MSRWATVALGVLVVSLLVSEQRGRLGGLGLMCMAGSAMWRSALTVKT
jgi:hypothetical protein